jgi:SAM-dependent methyltransferase
MTGIHALLNRPMLPSDLAELEHGRRPVAIRDLVRQYREAALPVLNGSLAYSNLAEGNDQILTCNPYRLWEYSSLFLELDRGRRCEFFVDIGGAGSALSFLLAENGFRGKSADLQPLLVALCNHVAAVRNLPLQAVVADVTTDLGELAGKCDLVTFISVLEHIPAGARPLVMRRMFELLRPGGLLYITFDYGTYREVDAYRLHEGKVMKESDSIATVDEFAAVALAAGFRFVGNDPRELPAAVQALQSAPDHRRITWRYTMNIGAIDAATPWSLLAKYLVKRLFRYTASRSRFEQHNFFRAFLEKPAP